VTSLSIENFILYSNPGELGNKNGKNPREMKLGT